MGTSHVSIHVYSFFPSVVVFVIMMLRTMTGIKLTMSPCDLQLDHSVQDVSILWIKFLSVLLPPKMIEVQRKSFRLRRFFGLIASLCYMTLHCSAIETGMSINPLSATDIECFSTHVYINLSRDTRGVVPWTLSHWKFSTYLVNWSTSDLNVAEYSDILTVVRYIALRCLFQCTAFAKS